MGYIFEVTIEYCGAVFGKQIEKTEVKVFSSEKLAIEFLAKNSFVYGAPYPFKQVGWYYYKNINTTIDRIVKFVTASITKLKIDDESICEMKYSDYVNGKEKIVSE